jgi:hypothetical protein
MRAIAAFILANAARVQADLIDGRSARLIVIKRRFLFHINARSDLVDLIKLNMSRKGAKMRRLLSATAAIIFLGAIGIHSTHAQNVPTSGILADGNAVVTGFSGAQPPMTVPPGIDPADRTFIDLNGPAARVIDLQAPGAPPQAQLINSSKQFTVTASQVGQVFAVALDNATPPNIYLAATSAYGLPIVVPGAGGSFIRVKQGAPNARFMPGLFGPAALQGGPGSIWRIDGATGAVSLFANVALNGAPNLGPALGGLAFDPVSNTLLVADRATGMIHGFDLNGTERGQYDHGTQGRPNVGLAPVSFNPAARLNITDPQFQTNNPATWGYAPPERRIFGLAVRMGRLYYAVAEGLQIWSVGIGPDGFGTDARLEITVKPGQGVTEISKITFDDQGRMLLAERAAPTGAFDFAALTGPDGGRVLRYAQTPSVAGPQWQPTSDEYAIGFSAEMRNGNGGVAVGYGYDATGGVDRNLCGGFVWSTGEQLRVSSDTAQATQLAQSGPTNVNGLQGNGIELVRPANVPPLHAYFVDYDDRFDDRDARGHLGDIAIWRICAQAPRFGLPGLPGLAVPRPLAPPPTPLPGPPVPLPPGLALPPGLGPQACPAGTHPAPGSQCCMLGTQPGPDGQCHSLCPPGSPHPDDQMNEIACYTGLAPQQDPAHWNPAIAACLDGTPAPGASPMGQAAVGGAQLMCKALPGEMCPVGYQKVPAQNQPHPWWTDFTCVPTPQEQQCSANGQELGSDGQCHAKPLCPQGNGPTIYLFPANQCCPDSQMPDPVHPGACAPPQQVGGAPPVQVIQPGVLPASPPGGAPPAQVIQPGVLPASPAQPPTPSDPSLTCPQGWGASLVCCAFPMSPDATGTCRSPPGPTCGPDLQSMELCFKGYFSWIDQPLCLGQTIVQKPPPSTCPQPPGTYCPFGYKLVGRAWDEPPPALNAQGVPLQWGVWTYSKCVPTDEQQKCTAQQQLGLDLKCGPTICAPGSWAHLVCSPPKQTQTVPQQPPSVPPPLPFDPNACFPGYTKLPNGQCCLTSQMTAGGVCCPSGQMPDSSRRSCVPIGPPPCGPDEVRDRRGRCVTTGRPSCGPDEVRDRRGRCVTSRRTIERPLRTPDRERSNPWLYRQRSNPPVR